MTGKEKVIVEHIEKSRENLEIALDIAAKRDELHK